MNVLYVSYNGLLEPIGRSQVFRYVLAQSARHRFSVLSFEKSLAAEVEKRRELSTEFERCGATWTCLSYARRPRGAAAGWNLVRGVVAAIALASRHRIDVIHARSYLGALIALPASVFFGIPLLFDMRGFWPDEGVGVGRWRDGSIVYRVLKRLEHVLLLRSAAIVTLTESGARHLAEHFPAADGKPVSVIPTCADITRFSPPSTPLTSPFVLGYAGSANEAYLFDGFLDTYTALVRRRPDARMLILNRHDHEYIRDELARRDIPAANAEIVAVDHDQMPRYVGRMTVGTIFVRPYAAKIGSAPTKLAEFLACGVPCLANEGCGDVVAILEREGIGVGVEAFSADRIERMVDRLLGLLDDRELSARCRSVAERLFSLDRACDKYDELYRGMVAGIAAVPA